MSLLIGSFVLGILSGWLMEWIYVTFFISKNFPSLEQDEKATQDPALQAALDKQQQLQQQLQQLQESLTAAQATIARLEQLPPLPTNGVNTPVNAESVAVTPVTAEAVPVNTVIKPDDLTRLKGIGPRLAQIMQNAGIHTYEQLMNMSGKELANALEPSGILFSRAIVESWPVQAKLAAAGDWDGLRKYKSTLKA